MPKTKQKSSKDTLNFKVLDHKHISTSKDGIGMYTVKYSIGKRVQSATVHTKSFKAEEFVPKVNVIKGSRNLQKCNYVAEWSFQGMKK